MAVIEGGNVIEGSGSLIDLGHAAIATLRVASAVVDATTVTIGADVYEVDTSDASNITAGNIRLDLHGGSTVKAAGTITSDTTIPTAGDTVTVGTKVYTWVSPLTNVDGNVYLGVTAAAALANMAAAINLGAGAGTTYAAAMTANAARVSATSTATTLVVTALDGGTAGNSIALNEAGSHTSKDAATLGTTTAGVDPTAGEFTTALTAAINASGTERVRATRISANEVLINTAVAAGSTSPAASTATTALAETLAGANNAWDTAALRAGAVSDSIIMARAVRVPNAQEVATGTMHFVFPFTPTLVHVQMRVTSGGAVKLYAGSVTITAGLVTLTNGTDPDFAATDTVYVLAIE